MIFNTAGRGGDKGIFVQRKAGTFTTNNSGGASVDCGFKPDLVVITGFSYKGTELQMAFVFPESVKTGSKYMSTYNDSYELIDCRVAQTTTGFSISEFCGYTVDYSTGNWPDHTFSRKTFSYVAVKYTV